MAHCGSWLPALLLLAAQAQLQALDPNRSLYHFVHDAWGMREGMPATNGIKTLAQTSDGYLWIGCSAGLIRFDGKHFVIFDSHNTPALAHSSVWSLAASSDGGLWISTYGGGLVQLKRGRFRTLQIPDQSVGEFPGWLHEDRRGDLWVALLDGGLGRLDTNGSFSRYSAGDGLPAAPIDSILEDVSGVLWVNTGRGLYSFRNGRFAPHPLARHLPDRLYHPIFDRRDNSLWAATSQGLVHFDGRKMNLYDVARGLASNTIRTLLQDGSGSIWVGTDKGLNRIAGESIERFSSPQGLTNQVVWSLFEDHAGNLWIGTEGSGLNRLKDAVFVEYGRRDGLPVDAVQSVFGGKDGRLWVGTNGGSLAYSHQGGFAAFHASSGLVPPVVAAIYETPAGDLLLGGGPSGLTRIHNATATSMTSREGLSDDTVTAILQDRKGALWVGTNEGGLDRIDHGGIHVFDTRNGLSSNFIRALHEDAHGKLWIGTRGGGLNVFDGQQFTTYTKKNGLSDNTVVAIYEDAAGTLWIGTHGGGLNRFRKGRFVSYTTACGLFDNVILSILEDGRGFLWMGTERGVFRVPKRQLEEYAEGSRTSVQSVAYETEDGLSNATCSGNTQPSAWKTGDGKLWFPTRGGLLAFDPEVVTATALPPRPILQEVRIDGVPRSATELSAVPSGRHQLEFLFDAIDLSAPGKLQFRYKLEGFDADWTDAGTAREAVYRAVPPGRYQMLVTVASPEGRWNTSPAAAALEIQAPFFRRTSFIALAMAGLFLAGWAIHRMMLNQTRHRYAAVLAERERISLELHDTLEQNLAGIRFQLDALTRKSDALPEAARARLDLTRAQLLHCEQETRRSVFDLRSGSLEANNLPEALAKAAGELAAGETFAVKVDVLGERRQLTAIVEHNLFRIGQEAMTNAAKHARATAISAVIEFHSDGVILTVIDDGIGFELGRRGVFNGHFGLAGMRSRAKRIGARLDLQPMPGKGSTVRVEVTLPESPNNSPLWAALRSRLGLARFRFGWAGRRET